MKRKVKFIVNRFKKLFNRSRKTKNLDTYSELKRSRDFWIEQADFWSKMYQDLLRSEKALFRRYSDLDKMYHILVRERMGKIQDPSPDSAKPPNIDRLSDNEINRLIDQKIREKRVSNGKQ